MKRLPPPTFDELEVYTACASAVSEEALAATYAHASHAMMTRAQEYRVRAGNQTLHALPASDWGRHEQVIVGTLTKGDALHLYSTGMLKGAGRIYYDKLIASAPHGKCPYCRFGQAETLDHFLSKSRYPSYSVLPINLVPACMSCNSGKSSGVVTEQNQMPHPYFEMDQIEQDVWLVAQISQTTPPTAIYSINAPPEWPQDLKLRVTNYFISFDLARRYAVEAASELVSVSAYLRALPSGALRHEHLERVASEERRLLKNGWKAALYCALSASNWYSQTGYA